MCANVQKTLQQPLTTAESENLPRCHYVLPDDSHGRKWQSLKRNQTNPGCKQNRIRFYNVGIMVVMRLRHPDDVNRNNAGLAASLFLCLFMSKFSHFLYYNYDVVKIWMKNDENGLILIIRVLLTLTITQGTSLQALLVNMTMKIMRSWILNFFYHN